MKRVFIIYFGDLILYKSVFITNIERAIIAVNDDIITLFAIPKFSIIKPQIRAPNGPKEKYC